MNGQEVPPWERERQGQVGYVTPQTGETPLAAALRENPALRGRDLKVRFCWNVPTTKSPTRICVEFDWRRGR